MSNSDTLRTKYRESASFFLNLADQINDRRVTQVIFDPVSTARSLILHSIYERGTFNVVDNNILTRNGIESSTASCTTEVTNLIRSGGKVDQMYSDARQSELKRLKLHIESLYESFQEKPKANSESYLSLQFENLVKLVKEEMIDCNTTQRNVVSEEFYCTCCGSCLFPIHPGASLKAHIKVKRLRSSTTERRRASRYVAKQFNFDRNMIQNHRGGGRTFSNASNSHGSAVANVIDTVTNLKKNHRQRRLHDGLAKNKIAFMCLKCNHKKEFKGPHRRVKSIEKEVVSNKSNEKRQMTSVATERSNLMEEKTQKEVDFLSFGDESQSKAVQVTRSILTLNSKKKKKRTLEPTNKSTLQNFLSSLND